MNQDLVAIRPAVGDLSSEKLLMLLPTQSEIDELILQCRKEEGVDGYVPQQDALKKYMTEVIESPANHNAWRDLSYVFGALPMMQWRFLYVSHCLQPDDFATLWFLGHVSCQLGDKRNALAFIELAIRCAKTQTDFDEACEYYVWMKSQNCLCKSEFRVAAVN